MSDMLVRLYALPAMCKETDDLRSEGFSLRRAMAYESRWVVRWVEKTFNPLWAGECFTAFGRQPIGCFIAVQDGGIKGFCCLESTFRNFVGPIGLASEVRGKGVGRALMALCLEELRHMGYAYAVIGDAGEPGFFAKAAGAVEIAGSVPGPYPQRLKKTD